MYNQVLVLQEQRKHNASATQQQFTLISSFHTLFEIGLHWTT